MIIAFDIGNVSSEFINELTKVLVHEDLIYDFLTEYMDIEDVDSIDLDDISEVNNVVWNLLDNSSNTKVEFSVDVSGSQEPMDTSKLEKFLQNNYTSYLIITNSYFSRRDSVTVPASAVFFDYNPQKEVSVYVSEVVDMSYPRNRYFPYTVKNKQTPEDDFLESVLNEGIPCKRIKSTISFT